MTTKKCLMLLIILGGLSSCTSVNQQPPLETVDVVDIQRYMGLWYEIASYPNSFQKGCRCSTAYYSINSDNNVDVLNRCIRNRKLTSAEGIAKVTPNTGNTKLRVSFFWPFYGDYWVIGLAEDYSYAVVGHPSRKYLWILAREPSLPKNQYQAILTHLENLHYDVKKLNFTEQNCSYTDVKN